MNHSTITHSPTVPEALNAGQPVTLPKGANAIMLEYPYGYGPHYSLARQIDQFKGAGVPVLVTAGRVKLRTNGTGIWESFQPVTGKIEARERR